MKPRLYYADDYPLPLPPGDRFPIDKYRLLRERLAATGVFSFSPAPLADAAQISLAHDEAYVRSFFEGSIALAAMRRIGFPWSAQLVARTQASVGGTLAAMADSLERGWGGTLAGGTHHSFRDSGAGYCVFNDIAIGILSLRGTGVRRTAVIDLDVHQGDGTAGIFKDDPQVFTLSLHGESNFPFRKQASTLDISFPEGSGDEEYLRGLEDALPRVFEYNPEVVFYQSGVDGHASDRLGKLQLSTAGLARRDELVFEAIRKAGLPIVITLGGGYSVPIDYTVEAHANTFLTAAAVLSGAPMTSRSSEQ